MRRINLGLVLMFTCLVVSFSGCAGGAPKESEEQIADNSLALLKWTVGWLSKIFVWRVKAVL